MRVYSDLTQAANEIRRDLAELGTKRFAGYQSVNFDQMTTAQRESLVTMELRNYDYRVIRPQPEDLAIPSPDWLEQEWVERQMGIEGDPVNPGYAWTRRPDIWLPLLEGYESDTRPGKFSYTYSERLSRHGQVWRAIEALVGLPHTRQAIVSIWDPSDSTKLGQHRVPCSLFYQFLLRDGKLDIIYAMRSNDFKTHWAHDLALAMRLQTFVLNHLNDKAGMRYSLGSLVHQVGSLHVYRDDVATVF